MHIYRFDYIFVNLNALANMNADLLIFYTRVEMQLRKSPLTFANSFAALMATY